MPYSGISSLLLAPPSYVGGWQDEVLFPDPGAGAGFTAIVPGDVWWRPVLLKVELNTSIAVANRFLRFRILDQNGVAVAELPVSGTVVASTFVRSSLMKGVTNTASGASGSMATGMPDIVLPSGWGMQVFVSGQDAADTLNNIILVVQKYPTPDQVSVAVS